MSINVFFQGTRYEIVILPDQVRVKNRGMEEASLEINSRIHKLPVGDWKVVGL